MSDTLYLSLWYPNLRLEALPGKLTAVLGAFAAHGGEPLVYASTVWPVSWSETPVFQRVYGRVAGGPESGGARGIDPRQAVEEALELLHEDYAYEFQIGWSLWELETGDAGPSTSSALADFAQDDRAVLSLQGRRGERRGVGEDARTTAGLETGGTSPDRGGTARWVREPRLVRVTGFGPLFDEGAYEQDGHIRIDFGTDTPFLEEDADLDEVGARHVEQNVRQLVELTAAVEKGSGATARLLWSELGESLAQRLAARLGVGN